MTQVIGRFLDRLGKKSPLLRIVDERCVAPEAWRGRIDMTRIIPATVPRVCRTWHSERCVCCGGRVSGYEQTGYRTIWHCEVCGEHVTPHTKKPRQTRKIRGHYVPLTGRTPEQDRDMLVRHRRAVTLRSGSAYFGSGGFSAGFRIIAGRAVITQIDCDDNGCAVITTSLVRRAAGCERLVIEAWDGDVLGAQHGWRRLGINGTITIDASGCSIDHD